LNYETKKTQIMEVKIQAIHFDADNKLKEFINERVGKLAQFFDNIIATEVYLKLDKAESHENKIVEIKVFIPGRDLFASKQFSSFEEAVDETVDALRRQIQKHKEKLMAKH